MSLRPRLPVWFIFLCALTAVSIAALLAIWQGVL